MNKKNTLDTKTNLLAEQEVAKILGCSVSTLQNHRALGKGLPYYKIGKTVRYKYEDVSNYIELFRIEQPA